MVKELLSNPYDYDIYKSPEFINEAEVRQIIMGAVRGRLEPDGRTVAPLTVRRNKLRDGATGQTWVWGPGVDSVERPAPLILTEAYDVDREMPNGDVIKESVRQTNLEDSIYDTMTGCKKTFSAGDIEEINDGLRNLANALEQAGYEEGGVKLGQLVPSFQFESSKDGELPLTRLYLHRTDLSSLQIAADLISSSGARPDYGKFWIPYGREGIQTYRQDTLILEFSEYHDLKEAVGLLRERFMRDDEICMNAGEILYGLKIAGVPGAYIGQPKHRGGSFNREMALYFEEAIQRACKDIRQPQTGEILTDEWLDTMARKTTDALGSIMSKNGRTVHHALIDSDTTVDLIKLAGGV